jgi:TRAP-type C4-dicarboxylate transport system permease small subunit
VSDPTPPTFNNTIKGVLTITTLVFHAGIILFCLRWGDPANSLHSSALAWSFAISVATLAGIGIGALTPSILEVFKKQ